MSKRQDEQAVFYKKLQAALLAQPAYCWGLFLYGFYEVLPVGCDLMLLRLRIAVMDAVF